MNCYRLWTLPVRGQDPGPVDPDLGAEGQEPVGHGPELEDQDLGQEDQDQDLGQPGPEREVIQDLLHDSQGSKTKET